MEELGSTAIALMWRKRRIPGMRANISCRLLNCTLAIFRGAESGFFRSSRRNTRAYSLLLGTLIRSSSRHSFRTFGIVFTSFPKKSLNKRDFKIIKYNYKYIY